MTPPSVAWQFSDATTMTPVTSPQETNSAVAAAVNTMVKGLVAAMNDRGLIVDTITVAHAALPATRSLGEWAYVLTTVTARGYEP